MTAAPAFLLLLSCSFTVTKQPLAYEDLSDDQRAAVDRINENLLRMHGALIGAGGPGVDEILGKAEVGFEDIVIAVNFGDHRARVSAWEDLTEAEHELVAGWWQVDVATADQLWAPMAYDYMALHLAALEYVYVVQGVERVFEERPRLNVERDAQRLVGAYARASWPALFDQMTRLCEPMREQYDEVWDEHYGPEADDQRWFQDHLRELADPKHPTGYFYYLCRWMEDARARQTTLEDEMQKIKDRFGDTP